MCYVIYYIDSEGKKSHSLHPSIELVFGVLNVVSQFLTVFFRDFVIFAERVYFGMPLSFFESLIIYEKTRFFRTINR